MIKDNKSKKKTQKETTLVKIAGVVGEMAGRLVNQKEHIVEMAGNAIESVKAVVHDISAKRKPVVKKAIKKVKKKVAKKIVTPIIKKAKKAIPVSKAGSKKKTVTKSAKSVVKKVIRKAVKKTARKK